MKRILYSTLLLYLFLLPSCGHDSHEHPLGQTADLSNITVDWGTLSPTFDPKQTDYSVEVPFTAASITITPTGAGEHSIIQVNQETIKSGLSSHGIPLNPGYNIITISVRTVGGETNKVYTLTVIKLDEPNHDADLVDIFVDTGTLHPVFNPAQTNYSLEVPFAINSITITAIASGINSEIQINNNTAYSGIPFNIPLTAGENQVEIKIIAEDTETEKTYGIIINMLPPDNGYQAVILKSAEFDSDNLGYIRFIGEDTSNPKILALKPLVNDIFATYGNPSTSLDKARAIRDFVARTAVHPYAPFHTNTVSNSSVLPEGSTWTEFLDVFSNNDRVNSDSLYWWNLYPVGFNMLDALIGTLDLNSLERSDDGMMIKLSQGKYQIRSYEQYRSVLCSWQQYIFIHLLSAAGLHGMVLSTNGHDPGAVYIPELEKWVWEDPTFNEEFTLDGISEPLSPLELLIHSVLGEVDRITPLKSRGPDWDMEPYINLSECAPYTSYFNGYGPIYYLRANLNNQFIDNPSWSAINVQYDLPDSPVSESYVRVNEQVIFPQLGVKIVGVIEAEDGFKVTLSSSYPNHYKYLRKINNGSWIECSGIDTLPFIPAVYSYRSIDLQDNHGIDAIVVLGEKPIRE